MKINELNTCYCFYLTSEILQELVDLSYNNPTKPEIVRNRIIQIIEPSKNTKKKKYFIYKLNQITKPLQMISYLVNSYLKSTETEVKYHY